MIGVNTQHKAEKFVRSLQNARCLEKAKTCFDCFRSCSCQLVLCSASLAPLPLRLPQSALWWFTAGNSSSCSCSLKRGKLISSGRSSFWLEILWMIDNLQAPGFSSIARSSKEHADCTCNITEECNKNLSEEGRKSNRRTVLGQSYVSVPDNISSSCSQITKLGQQKLDVADQTLNNSDISPANSISHFQWHLFQVRFCCSVMPSVEHHRQSAI